MCEYNVQDKIPKSDLGFCPTQVAHITKERTARQITIERFEKMCIEHISYSTYVFSPDHIIKGQVMFWEYIWALKSDFAQCHFAILGVF